MSRRRSEGQVAGSASAGRHRPLSPLFWVALFFSLVLVVAGAWGIEQNRRASLRASVAEASPGGAATGENSSALPVRLQTAAPDFSLTAVDGSQVKLSDLRGKVVLVNFWATWCPPCKAEMPDLNALQQEYGSSQGLVVLGVDAGDDNQAAVKAFGEQNRLSFPLLMDPDNRVSDGQYAVRALPTSLIIDRSGKIRAQWLGQLSRSDMVARLSQVW